MVSWEQLIINAFSSWLPIPFFSSSIVVIIIITLLLKLKSSSSSSSTTAKKNIPGPRRFPIIGNLHQLVSALPHQRLCDLAREHGPDVMHLRLGEVPHVVVSSSRAAREVMKTHDAVFASRPSLLAAEMMTYAGSDLVFTRYGESYKRLRKICVVEVLGAGRVRYFRPVREEEVADLVRKFSRRAARGEAVDVSREMFWLSSRITCRTVLGKARELDDGFLRMVESVSEVMAGFKVSDLFPSLKFLPAVTGYKAQLTRMRREMESMLDEIIDEHKERRAEGGGGGNEEDLVDVLLNLQASGSTDFSLTMDNIKAVTVEVFIAGVETSATTIDWTMAEMMKDERVLRKAQEEVRQVYRGKTNVDESSLHELKYLDLVIKESLRLHPPLPLLFPRESQAKVEVCGYEIPAKTKVIVNCWAIGRDPQYWIEPTKFYPERFVDSTIDYKGNNFEFIPFGAGRRMCPGMLYATAVVKLTLANLLYHFDWKLVDGMDAENLDMTEAFGVAVGRKCSLCLIPIAYDDVPI
ncbi:unnamed protein product [Linum tenue]|uniref:Cytochrome P450 n=1 Tax=Linum tenue TaxID=586396 RepID=A0AAV0HSG0_9ROSI|nr:unnamed protein product [Linum tenue]